MSSIAARRCTFLARRHTQLGELPEGLSLLKQCPSLEEGFDPTTVPVRSKN
jgi:hypothetical protein